MPFDILVNALNVLIAAKANFKLINNPKTFIKEFIIFSELTLLIVLPIFSNPELALSNIPDFKSPLLILETIEPIAPATFVAIDMTIPHGKLTIILITDFTIENKPSKAFLIFSTISSDGFNLSVKSKKDIEKK